MQTGSRASPAASNYIVLSMHRSSAADQWLMITTRPRFRKLLCHPTKEWSRSFLQLQENTPGTDRQTDSVKWHNYLTVSMRLSALCVNMAVCKCLGNAPSANAKSCIFAAISASPSSIIAFITRPAPFTIAIDGCCTSTNTMLTFAILHLDILSHGCPRHHPPPTKNKSNNTESGTVVWQWGIGLAINRSWVQFPPGKSCITTLGKLF